MLTYLACPNLFPREESHAAQQETNDPMQDDDIPTVYHRPQLKPGRKPYYAEFPELVTSVTAFVKLHGYSAEARRRTSVGNTLGVSLADIVQHVKDTFPELKNKGISRHTVHRLLVAPHKGRRSASRYHGFIQAKVPAKRNDERSQYRDSHYCFAQVGHVSEFCAAFSDECQQLSADDMNKLNVGTLAVSRYHQLGKFFPVDDSPNYPDHDFPYRNAKLIPSGYIP